LSRLTHTHRWRDVLVDQTVEVGSQLIEADARRPENAAATSPRVANRRRRDREQFADGHATMSDDECLGLVEMPHDLAAVVAELTLRDRPTHGPRRGTGATRLLHIGSTERGLPKQRAARDASHSLTA
jgi:hypothetical protein